MTTAIVGPTRTHRCILTLLLALLAWLFSVVLPNGAIAQDTAIQPAERRLRILRSLNAGSHALYNFGSQSLASMLFDPPGSAFTAEDTYAAEPRLSDAAFGLIQIAGPIDDLRRSETPAEVLAGEVFLARILWKGGEEAKARERLLAAIAVAEGAGLGDDALFSALVDAAELQRRAGREDDAARLLARARACGRADCPGDAVFALIAAAEATPDDPASSVSIEDRLEAALRMAETLFPGRAAVPASLYQTVTVWSEDDRPQDAARYAELGFRVVEPALDDRQADAVIAAGLTAMRPMLRAGRLEAALAVADRVGRANMSTVQAPYGWLEFERLRARALQRQGAPDAKARYGFLVSFMLDTAWLKEDPGRYRPVAHLVFMDLMDTDDAALAARLAEDLRSAFPGDVEIACGAARLRMRAGDPRGAAAIVGAQRRLARAEPLDPERFDALRFQEAFYLDAAVATGEAARLQEGLAVRTYAIPESGIPLPPAGFGSSYDLIRDAADFRDAGNYEAAAWMMADDLQYVPALTGSRDYVDSQTLWQMAFTFARVGRQDLAFDLMDRAARIASALSFADMTGPGGGSLQLLERDRERYLLFVDIAWAALRDEKPGDMLVLSRY